MCIREKKKKKFKLDEIPGERERLMSCFISAKKQNYCARGLESILLELVLEQENQLPYLNYDKCVIEELRGCSLSFPQAALSSSSFSFGLCCSKGKF